MSADEPEHTDSPTLSDAKQWLTEHGYGEVAAQIAQIEAEWSRAGKKTRRNWWDVLAGSPDGKPRVVAGRAFPIIEHARRRQGLAAAPSVTPGLSDPSTLESGGSSSSSPAGDQAGFEPQPTAAWEPRDPGATAGQASPTATMSSGHAGSRLRTLMRALTAVTRHIPGSQRVLHDHPQRSKTAEYVALYRALEHLEMRRAPLFRDAMAAGFLTPALRWGVTASRNVRLREWIERYADWRAPGARTSAIGRTRFIDDVVVSRAMAGVDQLVLLGAGYDCRAHRLSALSRSQVFEVDRPETQAFKRMRLATSQQALSAVNYVAMDFAIDDLSHKLTTSGFSRTRPATFVWEGVTNYLSEAAINAVLRFVASAAPDSVIVFTYVHAGVIDGSVPFAGAERLRREVERVGEPWRFGLVPEQVGAFVAALGLSLEDNVSAQTYRRQYFGDAPADSQGYDFYRIAVARVPVGASSTRAPSGEIGT